MSTLMNEIFLKEVDYTSLVASIIGCWRKSEKFGGEFAQFTEMEMIEFNADGTGVWKQWDDSGLLKPDEDSFSYRLQRRKIIFSYASFPERYDARDYRVANGHLILIDDYGMLDETMEVYTPFSRSQ